MNSHGCGVSLWGGENPLELESGMGAQLCKYTSNHRTANFKGWVDFMGCELYPSKVVLKAIFPSLATAPFLSRPLQ